MSFHAALIFSTTGAPLTCTAVTKMKGEAGAKEKRPIKSEIKKERDRRWKMWCEENEWKLEDHPGFKHRARTSVVTGSNGMSIPIPISHTVLNAHY